MKKTHKILLGAGILILVIAGAFLLLNNYLENEIEKGLENEYDSSVSYEDISINTFTGSAVIRNLKIKEGVFSLEAEAVNLDGFSYSDYIQDKNITINRVHLVGPRVIFNQSDSIPGDKESEDEIGDKKIRVKKFSASGGSFRIIENDTATDSFYSSLKNLLIEEIVIEKKVEGALLPFTYGSVKIDSDSLYYALSDTHYMHSQQVKMRDDDLQITEFSIIPQYSKEAFDKRIPYEQDWIALKTESVNFNGLKFQRVQEQVTVNVSSSTIRNAHMEIYRNKLLSDDTRIKPMYSEMLRDLGFQLHMDSINIINSYIAYKEKVLESRPAGELSFHNIQAVIKNLSNRTLAGEDAVLTTVEANARFMGETDLSLNWTFDVQNKMDEFRISGKMGAIKAENINSFLVPAMNVEAEGNIQSLYYDFYGNRNQANGNMQLSYRDFNVNILKDGESERKSLLSRLANLIIKNDRMNEDVAQENINTTRDKTKSFWNFLWLCIRDGALSTFL